MIRINLLAVERGTTKRSAIIPAAHRVTIGASLILLATVLAVGWWFWSLRQTSQQLDDDIARAEIETQQLRSVLAQVQKFEARKAQLQQRVTLIEQLRRGQSGPVHLLDEISKALPDRLWLTELSQKGQEMTLAGMTTSLTGLSDFVANLESSAWFKKPVDIIDSEMASDPKNGDLVKFSVKATISNPEAPAVPVAGATLTAAK
ncbi:MAG: PilN domain-containing protein [Acidobacteria bacterium]|nr:PilN domain-containing protein [Acidobacteriota bacterium]